MLAPRFARRKRDHPSMSPAMRDIIDKYGKISALIRRGTAGGIYLFRKGDREVAIKRLFLITENGINTRALRELCLTRTLHHPNLMPLLDYGVSENAYLVRPYLKEGNLAEFRNRCSFPSTIFKSIVYQMIAGVTYLHSRGVVHRNLTLSKFLITRNSKGYQVKLTGLGRADPIHGKFFPLERPSHSYSPPEELLEAPEDRSRDSLDLWSLGLVIYELITTERLFSESTTESQHQEIIHILGEESEYSPGSLRGRIGRKITLFLPREDQWSTLILRTLRYHPEERSPAHQLLTDPFFDSVRDPKIERKKRTSLRILQSMIRPIQSPISPSIGVDYSIRASMVDKIIQLSSQVTTKTMMLALYLHDYLEISRYLIDPRHYQFYSLWCFYLALAHHSPISDEEKPQAWKGGNLNQFGHLLLKMARDTSLDFSTPYDFLEVLIKPYSLQVQRLATGILLFLFLVPVKFGRAPFGHSRGTRPDQMALIAIKMACVYFQEEFKDQEKWSRSTLNRLRLRMFLIKKGLHKRFKYAKELFREFYSPSSSLGIEEILEGVEELI